MLDILLPGFSPSFRILRFVEVVACDTLGTFHRQGCDNKLNVTLLILKDVPPFGDISLTDS